MSRSELTTFPASLHRLGTDAEGEATVVLKVPVSSLAAVTKLYLALGKLLTVRVETDI